MSCDCLAEQGRAGQSRAEQGRAGQSRAEQGRAEQGRAEPGNWTTASAHARRCLLPVHDRSSKETYMCNFLYFASSPTAAL